MKLDVLVAGELYADLILSGFDFWPEPGQEAIAKVFRRELGGGAAITACGLATLGTRTGLFGIVGADHHAWIAGRLAEKGVDTSGLAADLLEPTGFTVAVTTPRERAFFTYLGANVSFAELLACEAEAGKFSHARHMHLGFAPAWDGAADLFASIHHSGCTLSIDAGWHEDWLADPRAAAALRDVDLFFPNRAEAARMTGETGPTDMLRRFAEAGARCVALKLGAEGAALLHEGEVYFAPPRPVTPCDTTGAGDCFDAGFLHAWLHGEPPGRCLQIANLCGALSTEAYGGIEGFPTAERLARELTER